MGSSIHPNSSQLNLEQVNVQPFPQYTNYHGTMASADPETTYIFNVDVVTRMLALRHFPSEIIEISPGPEHRDP